MQTVIIQNISGKPEGFQKQTVIASLFLRFLFSLLASIIWPIFIFFIYPEQLWTSLFALPFIFFSFIEVLNYRLIALHQSDKNAVINSIAFVLFIVFHSIFWFVPKAWFLETGLALISFEWSLIFLMLYIYAKPSGLYPIFKKPDWKKLIRPIFSSSIPILISLVIFLIQQRMSLIFVDKLYSTHESSLFAAAQRLAYLPQTLSMILFTPILPKLTEAFNQGKPAEFANDLMHYSRITLYLGISALLIFALFDEFWITLLYGNKYTMANPIFLLLLIQSLLMLQKPLLDRTLTIMDKAHTVMKIYITTILLQIPLSIWLIPTYGGVGAAYALIFSTLLGSWMIPLIFSATSRKILLSPFVNFKSF